MKVLVACEESQTVCKAFRTRGHEAYSCDILEPSGGHPEWHIHGDALQALQAGSIVTMDGCTHDIDNWDLLIAHPPCTYLSNAGNGALYKNGELNQARYYKGLCAKGFFMRFYNAPISKICIENPTPNSIYELPPHSQVIQPYEYGHKYQKRTLLWLKGLPLLQPTNIIENPIPTTKAMWFNLGSKEERQRKRSKTFTGIAEAMAEQWGNL